MAQPKLEIIGLTKLYGGKDVLKGVSFTVNDGEFLSILGPSGCGKTTILRLLIGLTASDSGQILRDGADICALPPSKRGMGIVFQNYALFQNMTVLQNIQYALKFDADKKKNAAKIAGDLCQKLGLAEHKNKKPHKLSGGQQQRVAIARTLAKNPDIILLDEPLSALDAATRLTLRDELKHIQAEFNTTMIYITHDQEEAFSLSDRIIVMDRGEIVQIATPRELIDNPANEYVRDFVIRNLRLKIDSLRQCVGETL